jgi:DNA-binding HxlR family transcriptional regulator
VRTYGQYCPIARASEVLAERWTPIIVRNMLLGSTAFTDIAAGAPGLSRTLLTTRLRELRRVGVVETTPNPSGRGSLYHLTEAGKDLVDVMAALGTWGERWIELAPEHLDPGMVLHSWVNWYLAKERLPKRRVVAQFDLRGLPKKGARLWIVFDGERSEVCQTYPGFDVDLFVDAEPRALAEWHLGRIQWIDALRAERIRIAGIPSLARSLPTWNRLSAAAHAKDARPRRGLRVAGAEPGGRSSQP